VLCASEWNIGEALGVLQRKARLASRPRAYGGQKGKLHAELSLLVRMGSFELAPVWSSLLRESWVVAERRELYVAAALQIASARSLACEYFVSGDGALLKAARTEGLKAFDPEADEKRIGQVV
jgi:predicted nucleic acid-binding protein